MMTASVLGDLGDVDTWGVLLAAVALGGLGGLAQAFAAKDPMDAATSSWKVAIIGMVAAVGALWASSPSSAIELVGGSLLAGFFGRAVLAALQARVTGAIERERKELAIALARVSVDHIERAESPPGSVTAAEEPAHPGAAVLRAQLDALARR
jgi:hypothetical protein